MLLSLFSRLCLLSYAPFSVLVSLSVSVSVVCSLCGVVSVSVSVFVFGVLLVVRSRCLVVALLCSVFVGFNLFAPCLFICIKC